MKKCVVMKSSLETYEVASGQAININKFKVTYSPNVEERLRLGIQRFLRVETCLPHEKFLVLGIVH